MRAFCASRMASCWALSSDAITWPASTESPSRTVRFTPRPWILDEISTESPSMRPLTKRAFSGVAFRLHPARRDTITATSTQVRFIRSSLVIGLLGGPDRARQVRGRQSEVEMGAYVGIVGLREPVLRVYHFGVVRYALSEPRTREVDFLARQSYIVDAGFALPEA